jgi:hypothetical protein
MVQGLILLTMIQQMPGDWSHGAQMVAFNMQVSLRFLTAMIHDGSAQRLNQPVHLVYKSSNTTYATRKEIKTIT